MRMNSFARDIKVRAEGKLMSDYFTYIHTLSLALKGLKVADFHGNEIAPDDGLMQWCNLTEEIRKANATVYFVGNGASAMMASHMAADATKNGKIRSMAFNDPALLTAVSNDIEYKESFALPLSMFAKAEDNLITISSSGNSPNIIRAIDVARELGLKIITLSGMEQNNMSRKKGDLNFYIPGATYGIVEGSHQVLLHCWLDTYIETYLR